ASQACDVVEDETIARVIPTKTIPQGIVSAMMFNPDLDPEENFKEMKAALKNVISGSVTYAIKDTDIEGIHVTKGFYMGFRNKTIVVCLNDKIEVLKQLIEMMVDENSAILTVILGEDITEGEEAQIGEYLVEKYAGLEVDIKRGEQPVYSFLVGVE
ncbi:MAG: hypothetical protein WC282_04255, partial [Bacilli bacterium]